VDLPGVRVFRLKLHDLHEQGQLLKARYCVNGKQVGDWETTANVVSVLQILTVTAFATDVT
jgi:hypothetical protein